MKGKKCICYFLIIAILISMMSISDSKYSKAATPSDEVTIDEEGNFKFVTFDHKRTSNIYWSNTGFNICLKKMNGNPLSDNNRIKIYYTDKGANHRVESYNSKLNMTTFTISAELLKKKFNQKFKDVDEFYYEHYIATGAKLYFNNIFRIHWGNNVWKDKIQTLDKIKNPGFPGFGWSSNAMSDFPNHFDKPYQYTANPSLPAQVVYYLEGTTTPIGHVTTLTPTSKKKWGKLGEKTYHTLASSKVSNGVRCKLIESYYTSLLKPNKEKVNVKKLNKKGSNLADVKDQTNAKILEGGTLFVGILRPIVGGDTSESLEEDIIEPCPCGEIGSKEYNVLEGIPTTEKLYVNAVTPEYLSGYTYTLKKGEKVYPVTVSKKWKLTWTKKKKIGKDKKGKVKYRKIKKSKTETVKQIVMVKRKYSYYLLSSLDVYGIKNATFNNYAFLNDSTQIEPAGYTAPKVSYKVSSDETSHIKDPKLKKVILPEGTKNGGSSCPTPDREDFTSYAEKSVKKIKVKNDELIFNGNVLMEAKWEEEKTNKPTGIKPAKDISKNMIYKDNISIPSGKENGTNESTGNITYYRIKSLNSKYSASTLTYDIELNEVTIHTPVVCDAKITDKKRYNQMIKPHFGMASLVLGTDFSVTIPTNGTHNDYKGYGTRDYDKYTSSRQVKFPFGVYCGSEYIEPNSWTMINQDATYYLPPWVNEGNYTINCRAISINASSNNKVGEEEDFLNSDIENYVAVDSINVQVSGRIFGLQIYDITDYPLWQNVFRINESSLKLSGFKYKLGCYNANGVSNGQNSKYTFPLVNGSHPVFENTGVLKKGYGVRFNLKTIGNMYGKNDYVRIKPNFYFVDYKGENWTKVDLYYNETFNERRNYLVKVGSDKDKLNVKSFEIGDDYWQVPENELLNTSQLSNISVENFKSNKAALFYFGNMVMSSAFRTFIGSTDYIPNNIVPGSVGTSKLLQSVQKWYGEYYIPSQSYAVREGFDLQKYIEEHGAVDMKESFWLKEGYIVVNLSIETLKDGKWNLSYINKENAMHGYCNMWKLESGGNLLKTDCKKNEFSFRYGDFIMYYADKSVNDDYISGGTH